MLANDTVVVSSPDQVSAELEGDAIILNLQSGTYFSLSKVGARIWQMIQQPVPVADICNTIRAEYDVAREQCEGDVFELLSSLLEAGLIEEIAE